MILWLLSSWISYIVHAALIVGVVGTFFGSILNKVPFINNYAAILRAIALPLFIVAVFAEGYLYASKSWIEEAKKYEEKVKVAEQQSKDANTKLSKELADKNKEIKQQQVIIKEKIKEVQVKVNAECKVAPEAINIHNEAAKLK
jgi:hypothetical protein